MWFSFALYFAFITTLATFFTKKIVMQMHPLFYLGIMELLTIFGMLVLIIIMGGFPKVDNNFYSFMIASGLLDVIGAVSSTIAIKGSEISLISPIASFNPVFATLIAMVVIHESPTPLKFLGIVTVVIGSYLLNVSEIHESFFTPVAKLLKDRGVQLFLLANFVWGITPSLQKQAIFATHPQTPLFASWIGSCVLAIFMLPFVIKHFKKEKLVVQKNLPILLLLSFAGITSQFAGFSAFALTNVGYVTAIFKLSTLFTIILGGVFLKEEHIKERLLGAAVMLLGTVLIVL